MEGTRLSIVLLAIAPGGPEEATTKRNDSAPGPKGPRPTTALQSKRPLGRGRKSRLRRTRGPKKLFIWAVNGSESIEPHSLLVNMVPPGTRGASFVFSMATPRLQRRGH